MSQEGSEEQNAVLSYFIGPKGSNLPDFRANINTILDELLEARLNYFPEDEKFITAKVRRSPEFQQIRDNLGNAVRKAAQLLGEHSVPFWSPRYEAHMCMDLTMPSLLGYFMTMLYNPNNVALEASPITTLVELKVGQQLCTLFGYNTEIPKSPSADIPVGWGHITSGGSVANLESMWVARNLKFYPLALVQAMKEGDLKFVADRFKVKPCMPGAEEKLLVEMSTWELLNLRPETVLDLPHKLSDEFDISSKFIEDAHKPYNIQTVGREPLEKYFKMEKQAKYLISTTHHYSWPKAAAISGLGSGAIINIPVDNDARVDLEVLEEKLLDCAKSQTPVYAVVAVIGSTEEGAVDRLSKIVELRKELQDKHGLSFLIHADAAWGGYFATMLRRTKDGPVETKHIGTASGEDDVSFTAEGTSDVKRLVPALCLKKTSEEDLLALQHADSITVDPHKAGYIPYPAGSLVYRDGRLRHLVTWSVPYLSQGSSDNIGIYGVEGSKPGAAAMSAWFSNHTIGLNPSGYGMLLGEAAFTSGRLSAYYATVDNEFFTCVPFNMLPAEENGAKRFDSDAVNKQKQWIRTNIIGKSNQQIIKSPEAVNMLRMLGSDLNINAFAINWRNKDKSLNNDLDEANYLMKRVTDRLSVTSANTDPTKIPMFLTSTKFGPDDYGKCAQTFMERIGVQKCNQGLFVLRNVVMNPFPTEMDFVEKLMHKFEKVVKEEVKVCRERNTPSHRVQFLVQGPRTLPPGTDVFLVYQTSFHSATRRQQLILSAALDDKLAAFYNSLMENDPSDVVILRSCHKLDIKEHVAMQVKRGQPPHLDVEIHRKGYESDAQTGVVTFKKVIKSRPLNSANQDGEYPAHFMPFYLYGTEKQKHISHVLVRAPNIDLSASDVSFSEPLPKAVNDLLGKGLILGLSDIPEASKQPMPVQNKLLPKNFFFGERKKLKVEVWEDPNESWSAGPGLLEGLKKKLYTGTMTLGHSVLVDAEGPNKDKFVRITVDSDSWQKELDAIAAVLSGSG
ncbi:pyridoxal-dependent decarboxylase domain protein [Metarhizium brunneum]